jgi:sulfite exporter TauE/SafE
MILSVVAMAVGLVFVILGALIIQSLPGRGVLTLFFGAFMLVGGFVGYSEWRDNQCRPNEICLDE